MNISGIVFLAIVVGTLMITYYAARRTTSTNDFYHAGNRLSGRKTAAISGDYMSAASFLGIAGSIAVYGFDGFSIRSAFLPPM